MPVIARLIPVEKCSPEKFWGRVIKTADGCWPWRGFVNKQGYASYKISGQSYAAHRVAYALTYGNPPIDSVIDHLCRNRSCANPAHLEAVTPRENNLRGESIVAKYARASDCPNGHRYTDETTFFTKSGGRRCKVCREKTQREGRRRYLDSAKGRQRSERQTIRSRAKKEAVFKAKYPDLTYSPALASLLAQTRGEAKTVSKLTNVQVIEIRQKWEAGTHTQLQLAREYGVHGNTVNAVILRKTWRHI